METRKTEPNPLKRITVGMEHFFREKGMCDTTHPMWVIVVTLITALWLTQTPHEIFTVFALMFASFLIEILNSAIEQTNNRMGTECNVHTKRAKELASAATTLSRIPVIVVIGWLVFRKYRR